MTAPVLFDRAAVRRRRARAAADFAAHDFLHREVALRLADRLDDLRRAFPRAAGFGARGGALAEAFAGHGGIETLIAADLVPSPGRPALVADEECSPFAAESLDLIVSLLSLHSVNDLPGALAQFNRALRPDGLFLAAFFGGATLTELRQSLAAAEIEIEGGLSPRTHPVADLQDVAGLLQRAGFALPIADSEIFTVTYADPFALMRDLRGMGETNAVAARRKTPTRRATILRAADLYLQNHAGPDGRIVASFEVITAMGWRPDPRQQQPARRGSGTVSLSDFLKPDPA